MAPRARAITRAQTGRAPPGTGGPSTTGGRSRPCNRQWKRTRHRVLCTMACSSVAECSGLGRMPTARRGSWLSPGRSPRLRAVGPLLHVAAEGSEVTPSFVVRRLSTEVEADVASKPGRRALDDRRSGRSSSRWAAAPSSAPVRSGRRAGGGAAAHWCRDLRRSELSEDRDGRVTWGCGARPTRSPRASRHASPN
jgi:hypothetical protein